MHSRPKTSGTNQAILNEDWNYRRGGELNQSISKFLMKGFFIWLYFPRRLPCETEIPFCFFSVMMRCKLNQAVVNLSVLLGTRREKHKVNIDVCSRIRNPTRLTGLIVPPWKFGVLKTSIFFRFSGKYLF